MWAVFVFIAFIFLIFSLINIHNQQSQQESKPHFTPGSRPVETPKNGFRKVSVEKIWKVIPWEGDLYEKVEEARWSGKKYIYVSEEEYNLLNDAYHDYCDKQLKLAKTAELNNAGIQFEKEGLIEDAIRTYEECISLRYPATHAYDRLMILYRKIGDYEQEQRVINTAVEVFNEQNLSMSKSAKTNNPKYAKQIESALDTCENVKGSDGKIVFSPYNVKKYRERYAKVQVLLEKKKSK